jgi:UDP-glucose 4-epimerase
VAFRREAENQIFNIGSAQDIAIVDLAKMLMAVGGFSSAITFVPYIEAFGTRYEDIPRRLPDVSKINRVVGWEATTPLTDGLLRTINYYRNMTQTV